jgi:hypothetical protein
MRTAYIALTSRKLFLETVFVTFELFNPLQIPLQVNDIVLDYTFEPKFQGDSDNTSPASSENIGELLLDGEKHMNVPRLIWYVFIGLMVVTGVIVGQDQ